MPAPSFNQTRPFGEDVVFRSSTTGEHNIDVYLEAAERGGKTLGELIVQAFDGSGNPVFATLEVTNAAIAATDSAASSAATAATQAGIATTQAGIATTKAGEANASAIAAAASAASIAGGPVTSVNGMTGVVAGVATLAGDETLSNKTLTTPIVTQNIQVISTGTTAVRSRTYILTASLTLTLPAAPADGDWVSVVNRSGAKTPVIGRNGQSIMGLAEDLILDNLNASLTLVFADATRGWVWA